MATTTTQGNDSKLTTSITHETTYKLYCTIHYVSDQDKRFNSKNAIVKLYEEFK